jgi:hypothetical protein
MQGTELSWTRPLLDEETCVRAFRYYDADNSGSLDHEEIVALTRMLWYPVQSLYQVPNPCAPMGSLNETGLLKASSRAPKTTP